MSQYLLLNRVKVQNANCIAGFTWGFPAITHFLGFTHHLHRQLTDCYDISLSGCAVISHEYTVHAYRPTYKGRPSSDYEFIQSKNPPYLKGHDKKTTPPIIEEGKMNMTVSLVIELDKELVGNKQLKEEFEQTVRALCLRGRLAGGTILSVDAVTLFSSENDRKIKRALMPGFVLIDRSDYLKEHYEALQQENPDVEMLDTWLYFSALKQKARPKCDLITKYLKSLVKSDQEDDAYLQILHDWQKHLSIVPYEENWPENVQAHFESMQEDKQNEKLLAQWKSYCVPDEKTEAKWEYLPKPKPGYLVPIMTGYKAISPLYGPGEVENVRDKEIPARFVEAVHSIGEWKAVFRLSDIKDAIWRYDVEDEWYLCKQTRSQSVAGEPVDQEVGTLDFEAALANI